MVERPDSRMWLFPVMLVTFGLYAVWRRAVYFAVTTNRAIRGGGVVSTYERSVPLRHIQDVNVTCDWMRVCQVRITAAGAQEPKLIFDGLKPDTARKLADAIVGLAQR